jgi:uncharacterized protein
MQNILFAMSLFLASTMLAAEPNATPADYRQWQETRVKNLSAEKGWLSLVGLHWLEEGSFSLGKARGQGIRLAAGPKKWGTLEVSKQRVWLTPAVQTLINGKPIAAGVRTELVSDKSGPASDVQVENVSFILIDRSGRLALRVRNATAKTRTAFRGIDYFPYSAAHRIEARFEAYPEPRVLDVATIVGTVEPTPNPGRVHFQLEGKPYTLELLEGDTPDTYFTIFGDQTNGKETYGMARFLVGSIDHAKGTAVLDFNRAYNPPCAFTEFATCPMPPEGNRMRLALRAGEKKYGK